MSSTVILIKLYNMLQSHLWYDLLCICDTEIHNTSCRVERTGLSCKGTKYMYTLNLLFKYNTLNHEEIIRQFAFHIYFNATKHVRL